MKIATRDFGEMEIDPQNIISFKQPIYGFERLTKYVLLSDDEIGFHIAWLQSVEESAICFILFNPNVISKEYVEQVKRETADQVMKHGMTDPECWVIAVIPSEFKNTTVNLKSPVLVDIKNQTAVQLILESNYPISAPLIAKEECEGASC